jgi:hypothetical protein
MVRVEMGQQRGGVRRRDLRVEHGGEGMMGDHDYDFITAPSAVLQLHRIRRRPATYWLKALLAPSKRPTVTTIY